MKKIELLEAFYERLGGKPDEFPEPYVLAKAEMAIKAVSKELVYSGNPMSHLLVKRRSFTVSPRLSCDFKVSSTIPATQIDTIYTPASTGASVVYVFSKEIPVNGTAIRFGTKGGATLFTGISREQNYFVVNSNPETKTFQISNEIDGSPLRLTGGSTTSTNQYIVIFAENELNFLSRNLTGIPYLKLADRFRLVEHITPGDIHTIEPVNSWDALETLTDLHQKDYYRYHNNTLYLNCRSGIDASTTVAVEHYEYLPLTEFPYELVDLLVTAMMASIMPKQEEPRNAKSKK
jgi:hypothetical protein